MKCFFAGVVFVVAFFCNAPAAAGMPYLAAEPALNQQLDWNLMPNGLLCVDYDRDGNGKADFHTLRIVVRAFYSLDTIYTVTKNNPRNLIFFVGNAKVKFYYVAVLAPLLYAIDINEDGHWDLIYKDVSQDGVNGNEQFYDSPSGMFAPNIQYF
ncbi:MAG: hypothetical protein ACE5G9_11560 [Nitrospinales bacterium]